MEHNKYYRVFRVLTDKEGNIVHKTPIGRAKTMQGARALVAGTSGLMPTVIETIYYQELRKEIKMWVYRAVDEYGLPVAESYRKSDLIDKLIDEFGEEILDKVKIIRVFEKSLNQRGKDMSYEEFKSVMSEYGTFTEEELKEMYAAEMRAEYDIQLILLTLYIIIIM